MKLNKTVLIAALKQPMRRAPVPAVRKERRPSMRMPDKYDALMFAVWFAIFFPAAFAIGRRLAGL